MQTCKRRYTYEAVVLMTMVQPPLSPRRPSVNTILVRDVCLSTNGAINFATLTVESFGRIGVEGSNCIDQLAAIVVGRRDGGSMTKNTVVKEHLPNHLGDYTGRHLEEGVALPTPA